MRSESATSSHGLPRLHGPVAQRGGVRSMAEVLTELLTRYRSPAADGETILNDLCRLIDGPQPSVR